jgi:hypothetical protein
VRERKREIIFRSRSFVEVKADPANKALKSILFNAWSYLQLNCEVQSCSVSSCTSHKNKSIMYSILLTKPKRIQGAHFRRGGAAVY